MHYSEIFLMMGLKMRRCMVLFTSVSLDSEYEWSRKGWMDGAGSENERDGFCMEEEDDFVKKEEEGEEKELGIDEKCGGRARN